MDVYVGELTYIDPESTEVPGVPLVTIIPAVVIPVAVIFLCCVVWIAAILLMSRREYREMAKEHQILSYEMQHLKSGSAFQSPLWQFHLKCGTIWVPLEMSFYFRGKICV